MINNLNTDIALVAKNETSSVIPGIKFQCLNTPKVPWDQAEDELEKEKKRNIKLEWKLDAQTKKFSTFSGLILKI